MRIEEEIQQFNFKNIYQKLHINVLFTASWINQQSNQQLKSYNITWQQFNILRILRGSHPKPATVKLLSERMIDKMSNASRLVEKLRQKGLVERTECPMDRRQVDVKLTDKGLILINEASENMESINAIQMNTLSEQEAATLNQLLDKMRF
ncbi:MAG: MarR family transcriptional regulator [Saprospiraceae bacterium]|nr:MarR family transcriptional regulator [Saprospiraceae bacterium]